MTVPTIDAGNHIVRVGVVGNTRMTAGIAQVFATAGMEVKLFGSDPSAVADNIGFALGMLERQTAKGKLSAAAGARVANAIRGVSSIAELRDCAVVIESMLAAAEQTRECLREIEAAVSPQTVIALNTSARPVTQLARHARHPERIAGLHLFEPVPVMRVAEIIPGLRSSQTAVERIRGLVMAIGHTPIVVADTPGFVVNFIGRALLTEGLRIVQESIASAATVDTVVRSSLGLRMGPFELLDLIGLDVSAASIEQMYHAFQHEPRLRPTPLLAQRQAAGWLGRSSGQGFYSESQTVEAPQLRSTGLPAVWVDPADKQMCSRIRSHLSATVVRFDDASRPSPTSLCLITPLGEDTSAYATRTGLDATRVVAVDASFDLGAHATLMATPLISHEMRMAALTLFAAAGPCSWIEDSPGFIAQRMLAAIVNLGCEAAQQAMARPRDIDLAVQGALGYPRGPLSMGDAYGPPRVATVLSAMHALYGDARYRLSPWLRRRAQLGVSLLTTALER